MDMILYIILIFLGFLTLILAIPIRIRIKGQLSIDNSNMNGNVRCLVGYKKRGIGISVFPNREFSLGRYKKPLFSFTLKGKERSTHTTGKNKRSFGQKFFSFKRLPLKNLSSAIMGSIHWVECSFSGKLGLNNPMQTGVIFGWLYKLKNMLQLQKIHLKVKPDFSPELDTDILGMIHIRLSPIKTVLVTSYTYFKHRK